MDGVSNPTYIVNESKTISETLEGETIIINLENGNYYSLNTTASELWAQIVSRQSQERILAFFAERYGVVVANVADSVNAALQFLKGDGLILEVETDATAAAASSVQTQKIERAQNQFAAPRIDRYQDMQEMLLADPIHDVDEVGWPTLKNNGK